jgi:hypothetical protein
LKLIPAHFFKFLNRYTYRDVTKILYCNAGVVVFGNTYQLVAMTYLALPGWYQYCLGLQLAASRVSLAVNGQLNTRNLTISILNRRNSSLAASTVTANSEMFGYLNIHSKDIAEVYSTTKYSVT